MKKQLVHPIEQYAIDAVRRLRYENKLRARDIATIINTSPSFVGNVESINNPARYNLKQINLIAAYFSVSPRIFLPDEPLECI